MTISIVQVSSRVDGQNLSPTISVTFTNPVTAGNTVVLMVGATNDTVSYSDPTSQTTGLTKVQGVGVAGDFGSKMWAYMAASENDAGGGTVFSATFNANIGNGCGYAVELHDSGGGYPTLNNSNNHSGSATAATCGLTTTAAALQVGWAMGSLFAGTIAAGSGYTSDAACTSSVAVGEHLFSSSTGAQTVTATLGSSDTYLFLAAAYKSSGGGGGTDSFTSTATVVSSAVGTLTAVAAFTSTATAVSSAVGTLTAVAAFTSTATAVSSTTAVFTNTGNVYLVGTAVAVTTGTGTLTAVAAFTSTATAVSSAVGTFTAVAAFTSTATVVSSAVGTLTAVAAFTSTATAVSSAVGTFTAVAAFTSTATAVSSTTGIFYAGAILIGAATADSSGTHGALTVTGNVYLVGTAAVLSSTSGTLTSILQLAGTAFAISSTTGILDWIEILAGVAAADTSGTIGLLTRTGPVNINVTGLAEVVAGGAAVPYILYSGDYPINRQTVPYDSNSFFPVTMVPGGPPLIPLWLSGIAGVITSTEATLTDIP